MIVRRHSYTEGKITAIYKEAGNYLWIAYKNTSSCKLKKVSIFDPTSIYFNITVDVDEILEVNGIGTYIYLTVDDDTYIGARYFSSNPLATSSFITKPAGITEKSIDLTTDSTHVYLLLSGTASGTNAKILKYDHLTLALTTTYDLSLSGKDTIYNAKSITIDDSGNLWVVTYTSPSKLIKVWETSGGSYDYQSWTII